MPFAFFSIPSDAGPEAAVGLNTFLKSHKIVRVTREWCGEGPDRAWAFCVEYLDGATEVLPTGPKVDYREVLPPEQFEVFARLRNLRKVVSEREGQPPFAIFTNAQLAEMVRRDCRTLEDLKAISGIGEARVAKYGAEVLTFLASRAGGAA